MSLEKLKTINLLTLDVNSVEEHVSKVLSLGFDDAVSYLEFAIDKFYKMENNEKIVELFFDTDKFTEHYKTIYNKPE